VPFLGSLGDWQHGWQCCASRIRTNYSRERTLPPSLSFSACALLRRKLALAGAGLIDVKCNYMQFNTL